MISLELRN